MTEEEIKIIEEIEAKYTSDFKAALAEIQEKAEILAKAYSESKIKITDFELTRDMTALQNFVQNLKAFRPIGGEVSFINPPMNFNPLNPNG